MFVKKLWNFLKHLASERTTIHNTINFIWGEPMKKSILVLLLLVTTLTFAKSKSQSQYSTIEKNLLVGINSENRGLKLSSAYFLGELKSDKAIIPLLEILHSSEECCAKQVAALALYKINSARGMFAIKQAIKFEEHPQTKKICKILYNQYLLREQKGKVEVEPIISRLDLTYGDYKLSDFE